MIFVAQESVQFLSIISMASPLVNSSSFTFIRPCTACHENESNRFLSGHFSNFNSRPAFKNTLKFLSINASQCPGGGGHSLSEVTGMCLLQVKSRGLSGKMCTLQNMGSFSKQPE